MILPATSPGVENRRALIIFAKQPLPGTVKTRLSPPLTTAEAATLYDCMLRDTMETATSLAGITPFLFFQDDPGAGDYFAGIAPDTICLPQRGNDLGERMKSAFQELFDRKFTEVAIIGTDSPHLPPEHVYEAFALLEFMHTDLVFGPAWDGGYYLLAMKRVWDELFGGLPWSSGDLLAASVEAAKDACLGASFLPEWHDLDTADDLQRPELLDENNRAKRTREFLLTISGHFKTSTR